MKRTRKTCIESLEGRLLLSAVLGDVNYDGRINIDDYFAVDSGYAQRRATYDHGDLDRSGVIDAADYLLLDRAFLSPATAPVISLHLDAGGAAGADSAGRRFEADGFFSGGVAVSDVYDVLGTPDDGVYSSYRAGASFSFSRTMADGHYAVFLEFAEPDETEPGQRVFDVAAEGELVLDDFDILAQAAPRTVIAATFDVHVTDGALDLVFTAGVGEALVSAIVAVPTDVPAEARPYSMAYAGDQIKSVASVRNLRVIGTGLTLHANENRGKYPGSLASLVELGYVEEHERLASPRAATAVPRGELTAAEQVAWVESLEDYVYQGAGRNITMPAGEVLAYENPVRVAGPINVLFADGSVDLLDRGEAGQLLGFDPFISPDPTAPTRYTSDPAVVLSATNLFEIGQESLAYANDHRARFPADFGVLAADLDLASFINPRLGSGVTPPGDLSPEERAAWARATTDYVYLGTGLRPGWGTGVLAHENPAGLKDGLLFLFTDGRVEFRETRWAAETLARAQG